MVTRTPAIKQQLLQQLISSEQTQPATTELYKEKPPVIILTTTTMPYRSAILAAIESLKDHDSGSPISSIRRHILNNNDEDESDDSSWNEVHFQKTLKTLVEKGDLLQLNGINYKFSNEYLQRLRARAEESLEDHHHAHNHKLAVEHSREVPPKEGPKKKTIHAKMKINEGKIITVVNPEVPKPKHEDDMDTTPTEEEIILEGGGGGVKDKKKKHHVKIIPRKVVGTTKNIRMKESSMSVS